MRTPTTVAALLAQRGDRLQRRAAGRRDVLDDEAAVVVVEERALDAALQPVRLGLLAHEERLAVEAAGQRGAGDGVGAHRQTADRGRAELARRRGHQLAQREKPGGPQDRPLGVDVVLRGRPAGEHDLPDDERVSAQFLDQASARIHGRRTLLRVLEAPLRALAIACSIFVVLGFGLFAIDETR